MILQENFLKIVKKGFCKVTSTAAIVHIYYKDVYSEILECLKTIRSGCSLDVYLNVSENNPDRFAIRDSFSSVFQEVICTFGSNIGKDIGGKLLGLNNLITRKKEYQNLIFIHDKKSPQVIDGDRWRYALLELFSKPRLKSALSLLQLNNIGAVCTKEALVLEHSCSEEFLFAQNKELILELAKKYNVSPPSFDYCSGTIFVSKAKPFVDFFNRVNPLLVRKTLEPGNVLDLNQASNTHAWERLLSWIVSSNNLTLKGV